MNYLQFKHKFLLHGKGKPKPKLSVGRGYLTGVNIGNYALFAGGYASYDDGGYSAVVDAFDEQMTRYTPSPLKDARYQLAATYVGDYALFGGGRQGSTICKTVDTYNTSLTKSTASSFNIGRYQLAAASIGTIASFAGGYASNGATSAITQYNSSLTKTEATITLTNKVYELAATATKNKMIFAGGHDGTNDSSAIVVIDSKSTVTKANLLTARKQLAATHIEFFALFGGGHHDGTVYPTVDLLDEEVTIVNTAAGLSKARKNLAAMTDLNMNQNKGKAIFAGGEQNSDMNVVDAYDNMFTHTIEKPLSKPRRNLAAAAVGNRIIFAGGYGTSPYYSDAIDVYTVD